MWFIIIEQLNNDTLDRFILVYNSFNNKDTLDGCIIDTTYSKLRPEHTFSDLCHHHEKQLIVASHRPTWQSMGHHLLKDTNHLRQPNLQADYPYLPCLGKMGLKLLIQCDDLFRWSSHLATN